MGGGGQLIPPWDHSFRIGWHNFEKWFPLGGIYTKLSDKILQGITPWGHICHFGWHCFDKGLPLGGIYSTLTDINFANGISLGTSDTFVGSHLCHIFHIGCQKLGKWLPLWTVDAIWEISTVAKSVTHDVTHYFNLLFSGAFFWNNFVLFDYFPFVFLYGIVKLLVH